MTDLDTLRENYRRAMVEAQQAQERLADALDRENIEVAQIDALGCERDRRLEVCRRAEQLYRDAAQRRRG